MRPACITAAQELLVLQACSHLPPSIRNHFLASVANRLADVPGRASDAEVHAAIQFTLGVYGCAVGREALRRAPAVHKDHDNVRRRPH